MDRISIFDDEPQDINVPGIDWSKKFVICPRCHTGRWPENACGYCERYLPTKPTKRMTYAVLKIRVPYIPKPPVKKHTNLCRFKNCKTERFKKKYCKKHYERLVVKSY